jgi:hypothetical protein
LARDSQILRLIRTERRRRIRAGVKGEIMKTVALGMAASLALLCAPLVRAEEDAADASQRRFRNSVVEKLTPEQLQALRERAARRLAAARARAGIGRPSGSETPADTCPLATPESATLPFGPVADTTVGLTNDYEPATSPTLTCSASTPCTGRPTGRGEVYVGTGWGPDKAYRIRTDANCTLTIDLNPTDTGATADDLSLLVFQAQCTNDLVDCACASDSGFPSNPDPNGNTEGVVLDAVAGTDYFIVIDGYSTAEAPPGDAGPFTLGITGSGCNLVTPPSQYFTVTPCRLIDTRNPNGTYGGPPLAAGFDRIFPVAGQCGVPATASAVMVNATVVFPTAGGNLRIFPTGAPVPTVSALNFSTNQTRGNNGIFSLNAQGQFSVRLSPTGFTHLVVDVVGYFE